MMHVDVNAARFSRWMSPVVTTSPHKEEVDVKTDKKEDYEDHDNSRHNSNHHPIRIFRAHRTLRSSSRIFSRFRFRNPDEDNVGNVGMVSGFVDGVDSDVVILVVAFE